MTITELKKELAAGILRPMYLLYGVEQYLAKTYAGIIRDKADCGVIDYEAFGEKAEADAFVAACVTPPMSGSKRVILCDHTPLLTAANAKAIKPILESPPDTAVILFIEDTIGKFSRESVGLIKKHGVEVPCEPQSEPDLTRWVERECKLGGAAVSRDVARYIVQLCGVDMQRIASELPKLVAHGQQGLTKQTVDMLIQPVGDPKAYRLSEYVFSRDIPGALSLIHELRKNRDAPTAICAALYGTLADVHMFATYDGAKGVLPDNRRFLATRYAGYAKAWGAARLRDAMRQCAAYDRMVKSTTDAEPYAALMNLVIQLVHAESQS